MAKQIYFHVDAGSMPISFYDESTSMSYYETCELLSEKADTIHTTDMAHFSFDLIDMGYEIYLCYKGKKVKIEPDMTIEPIGKHLRRGHNIRKLFIGHAFDDMLGIDSKDTVSRPKNEEDSDTEFKIGQFVCHKYKHIYGGSRKIIDISNDSYWCSVPCSYDSIGGTCSLPFDEEDDWRLWAIDDARPGDVLSVEFNGFQKIVIFKSLSDRGVEGYGITVFKDRVDFPTSYGKEYYSKTWTETLTPATREQRKRLFEELEKAGYKWDNNKRELISTKPKLSVGNWVVYNNRELAGVGPKQIIDFVDDKYVLDYGSQGNISFEIDKLENDWRLWDSANDVKDGDVLALDGSVFIYAHRKQMYDIAVSHCFVNQYGEFFLDGEFGYTECGAQVLPATKEQRDLLFSKIKEEGYQWDEKKKVLHKIIGPKFKVGDWIAQNNSGSASLIAEDSKRYGYTLKPMGAGGFHLSHSNVEENFHLWTIADVKDGDVLCTYECGEPKIVFIHKLIRNNGSNIFMYYCFYNIMYPKFDANNEPGCLAPKREDVKPATKEQRDLLFSKMKEAGYEWDEKKKELKKIQSHYATSNFHAGMPVLVRILDEHKWCYLLFSHCYKHQGILHFHAGGAGWRQCIPFDGNEHLLGTTDMPDKVYINW